MHEGHSCTVWVEQSSDFFPRRLYSSQKSFLFISSSGAQQLAAPQLLCAWGCHVWEGDTRRSSCCARQAGSGAPPGTDVTLGRQGSTTQPHRLAASCSHPHPQGQRSPERRWVLSPCLCCVSRHYQPPHGWGRQPGTSVAPAVECSLGWGVRWRRSQDDVWRRLRSPPGSMTLSLCDELR